MYSRPLAVLTLLVGMGISAEAASLRQTYAYTSSVSADANGPLDLIAELNFDGARLNAPIAVVMHAYSPGAGASSVRRNAEPLRDKGFFVVSVAMRGRDGSDGVRDSGGLEIYDIFDAVEAVKADYAAFVDPGMVYITGYSGGGGNTMSALTKFPDYFNLGASNVGMSDYGFDPINGWYFNGAGGRTSTLNADVGNPNTGGLPVIDRYHARASNLASKNNPYSEIHLFANTSETISPIVNNVSYRDNAVSAASYAGEFDNITVHTGLAGNFAYVDHNNDGIQQDNERQDFPHSSNPIVQDRMEAWFLDRLLAGEIPAPVLNDADELFVAGWVRTKRFEVFLGDGQNAAAHLDYALTDISATFDLDIVSNDTTQTGRVTLDTADWQGLDAAIFLDGAFVEQRQLDESFEYLNLGDGQSLTVMLTLPGDFNGNGQVEQGDLNFVLNSWGKTRGLWDNAFGLTTDAVDQEELNRVLNNWGRAQSPSPTRALPEPLVAAFWPWLLLADRRRRSQSI